MKKKTFANLASLGFHHHLRQWPVQAAVLFLWQGLISSPLVAAEDNVGLVASMGFTFVVFPLSLGFLSAYYLLGRGSYHTLGKINFFLANIIIWVYFAFLGGPQSALISLLLLLPALQIYLTLAKPGHLTEFTFGPVKLGKKTFAALVLVPHLLFSHFMYREYYLSRAAVNGFSSISAFLVAIGTDPKKPELVYSAAKNGHADLAQRFIHWGASDEALAGVSIETFEFLALLAKADWQGARKSLATIELADAVNEDQEGPLHILAQGTVDQEQRLEMASDLLKRGLDPDLRDLHGDSALIQTVEHGQVDMVRLLLEHGAEQGIRGAGFGNLTAFERVLQKRHGVQSLKIFEIFVAAGANINSTDIEGKTALMQAVLAKNVAISRRLLELGSDPNAVEPKHNRTALFYVVGHLNHRNPVDETLLKLLVAGGADLSLTDDRGRTALAIFNALGRDDLVEAVQASSKVKPEP